MPPLGASCVPRDSSRRWRSEQTTCTVCTVSHLIGLQVLPTYLVVGSHGGPPAAQQQDTPTARQFPLPAASGSGRACACVPSTNSWRRLQCGSWLLHSRIVYPFIHTTTRPGPRFPLLVDSPPASATSARVSHAARPLLCVVESPACQTSSPLPIPMRPDLPYLGITNHCPALRRLPSRRTTPF